MSHVFLLHAWYHVITIIFDDVTAWNDLRCELISTKCFPGASSLIEILLLRDDRFYQHPIPLCSTLVCSIHKREFLKEHWISSFRKCWLCSSLGKATPNESERNINPGQALTIYEKFHIRHSYGKTICPRCRQLLTMHSNMDNIQRHQQAFEWINDFIVNDDRSIDEKSIDEKSIDDKSIDDKSDDSYKESHLNSSQSSDTLSKTSLDKKKRELLNEYLRLCGSKNQIKITNSYHNLQKHSKANFLSSARNLIQHIVDFLDPNGSDDFRQDLFVFDNESNKTVYDRQLTPVMRGVAEAYDNAENWSTRRSILSIVAPKINFSILQSFIPGITYYRFIAARLHASQVGTGALIEQVPRVVRRFEQAQIEHFIDFIVSNYVCTDMPFGQKTLILSDGTNLHVPDTIRNCDSSRIIKQYYTYTTELFPEFTVLHESTLYKVLNGCKASTRRAITGLNYFAANGSEAFDDLSELINGLNLDKGEHRRLVDNLKRGKQCLKTDFKLNVNRASRVRDHCICFSLSDPASNVFSISCLDHIHDQVCSECLYLTQTLQDISQKIQDNKEDDEELKRKMYKFTLAYDAIQAWKCHQLRAVNQDLGRECILDVLGEDAVYLNLDFAMKWLPANYREAQNDFFGKRGVTWHVTVVSRKKKQQSINIETTNGIQEQHDNTISDHEQALIQNDEEEEEEEEEESDSYRNWKKNLHDFEHTVFVHVIDQCPQDSKLVVAIITDILQRLKAHDHSIEQACIRTDNAGCYHSASTILSIPSISEKCGIAIRRMDFADPQGGKGSSDRFAAVIKSHVRRYLNEKHDVINAEQFVEACLSYGGIKNVNVLECRFKPVHQLAKFQLSNIKKFRNFCFERHGIRVFRAWDVGEGHLLPYNKLIYGKVNISLLDLIQSSPTINFGSSVDNSSSSIKDTNLHGEHPKSSNVHNKLFECPEEGCVCSFVRYGNLLRHLVIGQHRKMAEKITLLDTVKKLYHSKLTTAENKRVISLSLDHVTFDSNNFDELPQLNMGWGLPVVRPPVRFNIKQKEFLDEKFNEGLLYGRFWKPEQVVSEMQQVKTSRGKYVFSIDEWLRTGQVRSYFSRMRLTTMKKIDQFSSSNGSKRTTFVDNEDEQEQDLDDEANAEESFRDDVAVLEAIERVTFMKEINQAAGTISTEKRPLASFENKTDRSSRSVTSQNRKY